MYKYVLTGGHGVGKTSIILGLQLAGEEVIRESASDYQYYQRAKGNIFPFDCSDAENEVLSIQIERENALLKKNAIRAFLDRSVIDHFVYSKILRHPISDELLAHAKNRFYDIVFLIEHMPNNGISLCTKREQEYSRLIQEETRKEYAKRGFDIISIKNNSLENRMNDILKITMEYESNRL